MLRTSLLIAAALSAGCEHASTSSPSDASPVSTQPASSTKEVSSGAPSASAPPTSSARDGGAAAQAFEPMPLPGATAPVFLDYLVFEPAHARVWVPVADTGSVDAFDVASRSFTRVDGFKTAEREMRGKKRTVGPTAAAAGDGFVYVGNRATNEVCAVDAKTLKLGACLALPSPLDGVAYVVGSHEVWVTTPKDHSLTVLDATKPDALRLKTVVKVEGEPEGYGVDETRGLFFTNLEDADRTLAIDAKTHAVRSTWDPGCGSAGPRGLAVDAARGFVIVACTDHLQVLDETRGVRLGQLATGAGIDNIDYAPSRTLVIAAAGKAAQLTFARLDEKGQLASLLVVPTVEGARNGVVDEHGNAYLADPQGARLLVVKAPSP